MKAVILAGGFGTRLSEETTMKPKPMVEIGGRPILWHIMKIFSNYNVTEFIVCLGYKGYMIKEYFINYFIHHSDVTIDLASNEVNVHQTDVDPWRITLVDTGLDTMTGGRLKRVASHIGNETFLLTYGDGVTDLNIDELIRFHREHGKSATVTAVQPPGRFGALQLSDDIVSSFDEKKTGDGAWINGGFFVLERCVLDYIENDATVWEKEPVQELAQEGQLMAFQHRGFWQAMDTLRDKRELEALYETGQARWLH